jgi:hypothetical protein
MILWNWRMIAAVAFHELLDYCPWTRAEALYRDLDARTTTGCSARDIQLADDLKRQQGFRALLAMAKYQSKYRSSASTLKLC